MDSQVWTATIPTLPREQSSLAIREAKLVIHEESLEKFLRLASYLIPKRQKLHVPVLRHPDLQPNNVFVSNSGGVTSLIVLPMFLAAGIPNSFQNYGDSGSQILMPPTAPAGLDSLDDFERAQAQETFRPRHVHFHYLGLTQQMNQRHWRVLADDFDILRRRIFRKLGIDFITVLLHQNVLCRSQKKKQTALMHSMIHIVMQMAIQHTLTSYSALVPMGGLHMNDSITRRPKQ
jgi:hypothetical protein